MIDVPDPAKQVRYTALELAISHEGDAANYRWILMVASNFEDYINNGTVPPPVPPHVQAVQ